MNKPQAGLALVVAIGGAAWLGERALLAVTGHAVVEAIVLAILIGAAVRVAWTPGVRFEPGIALSAGLLLEVSIVLLGFGADLAQFARAGLALAASVVGVVVVALVAGVVIGRAFGLSSTHALLVACGNAICGNSAIAAIAPVIGARRDEVASAISYTAVLGVVVILLLPQLAPVFALDDYQYGVLAGLTVYAVPQVMAAAFPVSVLAGQTAMLVKLVRVLLLGPLVLVLAIRERRRRGVARAVGASPSTGGGGALVPWFVVGFLLAGALRSVGLVTPGAGEAARNGARLLTVLAMAAIGLGVDVRALRRVGPRVAATVTGSLAVMVVLALVIVRSLPPAR